MVQSLSLMVYSSNERHASAMPFDCSTDPNHWTLQKKTSPQPFYLQLTVLQPVELGEERYIIKLRHSVFQKFTLLHVGQYQCKSILEFPCASTVTQLTGHPERTALYIGARPHNSSWLCACCQPAGQFAFRQEAKSGTGTASELFVFPLLCTPVSICCYVGVSPVQYYSSHWKALGLCTW